MPLHLAGILCAAACAAVQTSTAQPGVPPSQPSQIGDARAQRVSLARDRAAVQMEDQVRGVRLADGTTVGEWLARSVPADRALRAWIRGLASQPPRWYSDGSCEIDLCLPAVALRDGLQELSRSVESAVQPASPATPHSTPGVFAALADGPTLWATGVVGPSETGCLETQPGWECVTCEGIQLAQQAASAAVRDGLLNAACELRLSPSQRLRSLLETNPTIADAMGEAICSAARIDVELGPDRLAEGRGTLATGAILRALTRLRVASPTDPALTGLELEEFVLANPQPTLTAWALAGPPRECLQTAPLDWPPIEPPWARETLTLVAETDPDAEIAEAGDPLLDAALKSARLRLRIAAAALPLRQGLTVADVVQSVPGLRDDVDRWLAGMRLVDQWRDVKGSLAVQVSLPLARLAVLMGRAPLEALAGRPEQPASNPPASGPGVVPDPAFASDTMPSE